MPILANPKHEAFARGSSAAAAYVEAGYKANRHNAAALARKQHISTRVNELQEEQLAIHQQAAAQAAANAQVSIESLRSRGCPRQGNVREGWCRCRCERSDRQGQTRWNVA